MHIQVQTLTGKTAKVNCENGLTVNELSLKIQESFGVPVEEQKLIFNGQKLQEGLLSEYGIIEEASVYLLVSIEGGKGKKKKKKVKKPKKHHRKRKVNLAILKYYKVEGGKVIRLRQRSPTGTFMAEHADRYYCGKSHITYKKKEETSKPAASNKQSQPAAAAESKDKGGKKKGK